MMNKKLKFKEWLDLAPPGWICTWYDSSREGKQFIRLEKISSMSLEDDHIRIHLGSNSWNVNLEIFEMSPEKVMRKLCKHINKL